MSPNKVALEKQVAIALNTRGTNAQPVTIKHRQVDVFVLNKAASILKNTAKVDQKNSVPINEPIILSTITVVVIDEWLSPILIVANADMATINSAPNNDDEAEGVSQDYLAYLKSE